MTCTRTSLAIAGSPCRSSLLRNQTYLQLVGLNGNFYYIKLHSTAVGRFNYSEIFFLFEEKQLCVQTLDLNDF